MLHKGDDLTGLDCDGCIDPETGTFVDPYVQELIDLAETYAEISPSGAGVRFFALGKIDKAHVDKNARCEVYGAGRYLTFTGRHIPGTPDTINPAPKTVAALVERVRVFKPEAAEAEKSTAHHHHASIISPSPSAEGNLHPLWFAEIFGGEATGHTIVAPGPGHSDA